MPGTPRRATFALAAVAGALLCASCGGGGGQLAQQSNTASTATPDTSAPSVTSAAPTTAAPSSAGTATTSTRHPAIATSKLESPRSAIATARELTDVENALRGDDRDPRRLARLGQRQQVAYRALSAHPAWVTRVERAMPEHLRAVVEANVAAGSALGSLTGSGAALPSSLPDWKVMAPQPASTLRGYYDEAEGATGIPWAYLAAIHLVESRVGRIHGPSSAGAQGPMQFIPATWERYGEGDITDDHDAILAAGRYLAARGGPSDMARALYSYNNDERYVAAVEAYAGVMLADPRAYDGYHAWQVFFATRNGTYLLPEGYGT